MILYSSPKHFDVHNFLEDGVTTVRGEERRWKNRYADVGAQESRKETVREILLLGDWVLKLDRHWVSMGWSSMFGMGLQFELGGFGGICKEREREGWQRLWGAFALGVV